MMDFLETIFRQLEASRERPVLEEVRGAATVSVTGAELLRAVAEARATLTASGLHKGDRCALLAHNGIRWAALDLAMMAEGLVVVPLYARQSPLELAGILRDCSPSLVCCGDATLRDAVAEHWPEGPAGQGSARLVLLDDMFGAGDTPPVTAPPMPLADSDPVTIIYTSGTSGEPKGVILGAGGLNHMLRCTSGRLDVLMGAGSEPDRVFHYLPFCFAGSWILLLTCLSRRSRLFLSTDLSKLVDEIKVSSPHYFLNVPTLLERVRTGIEGQLEQRGGVALGIFSRAKTAWFRRQEGSGSLAGSLWLALARALLFPAIRKKIGPHLRALICGSAPLARETQLFFLMLGLPVLQVYGLTETTAICTMDHPQHVEPGYVGPAIDGVEMKVAENGEILVRGPNLFQGYWNRPQATAEALRDGWFHTGDQGEVSAAGNWRISGRIKNLVILNSGHNIAPEPIEEKLLGLLPGAQQAILVGNGRSFVAAIVTGGVTKEQVEAALGSLNPQLPHYKQVHAFHLSREPFSIENGLLTANGKLKRDAIAAHFQEPIEELYRSRKP